MKESLKDWIKRVYPKAHATHHFGPTYDQDNIECQECCVRPYNSDASKPCPERESSPQ